MLHDNNAPHNRLARYLGRIATHGDTPRQTPWERMTAIEPRLVDLERYAAYCGKTTLDADFWKAWNDITRRLADLVGWRAQHPQLRNSEAYERAYDHLYLAFSNAAAGEVRE